jgi:hypothetical protein
VGRGTRGGGRGGVSKGGVGGGERVGKRGRGRATVRKGNPEEVGRFRFRVGIEDDRGEERGEVAPPPNCGGSVQEEMFKQMSFTYYKAVLRVARPQGVEMSSKAGPGEALGSPFSYDYGLQLVFRRNEPKNNN